jgi:hypothetical protein
MARWRPVYGDEADRTSYTPALGEVTVCNDTNKMYRGDGSTAGGIEIVTTDATKVVGPGSSTDNALARFNLATGLVIQESGIICDDSDNLTNVGTINSVTVETHAARHASGGGDTVDHDTLTNFAADEHVAHTGVTMTAGRGLTGGGNIAASKTFDVDIANEAESTPGSTDWILWEANAGGTLGCVQVSNLPTGLHSHTYQQMVTVAKAGGNYTTIQGAIDSITDATTTKRYLVKVYSGDYAESVTLKDYVDVIGEGRSNTLISATTGTALTFPANKCTVSEIGIVVDYGTLGAESTAITSAGADSVLKDCDITVTKSAGDFRMHAITVTAGSFRMSDCYMAYSITGATVGSALIQSGIIQSGVLTTIIFNNNELTMTSDDTNDYLVGFETTANVTGKCLLANNVIDIDTGAVGGAAAGLWVYGTANGAIFNQNRITIQNPTVAYGLYLDSAAGSAVADTRHNEIIVESAGSSIGGQIASGDTWNSTYDKFTVTTAYAGAGTVNFASSEVDGGITATGTIEGSTLTDGTATVTGGVIASATLTTPTIGDFTNATHDHADAAGGGTIAETNDLETACANVVANEIPIGSGAGVCTYYDETTLTEETTPAAGDFLLGWESGGAIRKFDVGDLPAGSETNTLSTVCTGIAADQVPVGSSADVATYTATNGTGNVVRAGSPTITTPTIASFANSAHDHADAAGGGTITAASVSDFDTEVGNHTDVAANTTHRGSDGSDHTFLDQSVIIGASPSFASPTASTQLNTGKIYDSTGSLVIDSYVGPGASSLVIENSSGGQVCNVDIDGSITVGGTVDGIDVGADVAANTADRHTRSHTLTSASDHTATANRVLYVDNSSVITELALGADGTYLRSNGATSAPTFTTPAGGGTVDTSGVPVANDYARFTDADTIEGREYSEVRTDLGLVIGTDVLAQQAIGIANDNLLEVDDAAAASGQYARFTANGLEGRSSSEVITDLGIEHVKSITIEDPADADIIPFFITNKAITITETQVAIVGGTSVVWTLYQAATAGATTTSIETGTASSSTPASDTSMSGDATVPADQVLNVDIGTVTGSVTDFILTVHYTED